MTFSPKKLHENANHFTLASIFWTWLLVSVAAGRSKGGWGLSCPLSPATSGASPLQNHMPKGFSPEFKRKEEFHPKSFCRFHGAVSKLASLSRTAWHGLSLLHFCVCSVAQSHPTLVTPWTVACQVLLFMENSMNIRMGCHFLLQGVLLTRGLNLCLLHWQADSLPLDPVTFL